MASQSTCEVDLLTDDMLSGANLKATRLSYTWTIDNFSMRREETGKYIESSTFSTAEHGNLKWCLHLFPNGFDEESQDFVSIYLRLASSEKSDVMAEYKFAVLDKGGRKTNVVGDTSLFLRGRGLGWGKFVRRDCLLKGGAETLLPNDKLTLYCEVLAFVHHVNIPQANNVAAVTVPESHLSEDFGHLLESRRLSDVILTVEGKDIHAHKSILASRCPVFAAMFPHGMKEDNVGRVEITDFNFEVLHEVVGFIYTGRAPKLHEMAEEVLVAANKYDLGRLKVMCEDILCPRLSVGTAAEMLALADMHNADQLKANALRFIKAHGAGVVETDGWKMMASEKPHLVAEAFRALVVENVAPKTGLGNK